MPKLTHIQKVLVIGSGPIVIGQAAEFDYAGTQACLALKEEGINVVLVNNNPATIMTDQHIADHVYLEPLTRDSLEQIIEKEQPDGLLPTLGGQTGLNLAVSLSEAGILSKYNVELLGTPLETIQKGEDREIFKSMMKELNEPVAESLSTESVEQAIAFAGKIGYPLIVRPAYTLGGAGGGIANTEAELVRIVKSGIHASPIKQVLIEQSVKGWKELEYEVMRDANDTCIIVCNMENVDPVGVHTGDSIVVAPSQTLNDRQYQMLRSSSCRVIRELGVIGGCNIQFALDPESNDYVIIEVNPRVSRSSALASKATGYPIARIAAKLALGYHLDEVLNPITGDTYASFEPAIDYVAVKIPRWPYDKFASADRLLGTQMKATGEVMALARNFPAALLKAVRSLEIGIDFLSLPSLSKITDEQLNKELSNTTDERIFAVAEAMRRGFTVNDIHQMSEINKFFLNEIALIINMENKLSGEKWETVNTQDLSHAKVLGFSDKTLANTLNVEVKKIKQLWEKENQQQSYKMVDTCAGEFAAATPYYYSSWNEYDEVLPINADKKMVVLGSGPIRIGQGVEFDYCSVQAARSLKKQNIKTIVINNNPETVSTDFNTADHLYFEPLTEEDVLHVVNQEKADGVLVQFGGQTAINLAEGLSKAGVAMTGTSLASIEAAEDRDKFYRLLQQLNIAHIPGETVTNYQDAKETAARIGYPVLIRPSYVIGGRGMMVVRDEEHLRHYIADLEKNATASRIFPLLIDQFVPGLEVEIDAVCDGEDVLIPGIFQHIEKAGIHSGDSIAVFPAPGLTAEQEEQIAAYTKSISTALHVKGIMNIQFVISEEGEMYVLEVNPRASRTVPIASKVTCVPLIDLATRVQMGEPLNKQGWNLGLHLPVPYFAVKMPVFSTNKLPAVDPVLNPEMKSTGEAIGMGNTVDAAMAKAFGWKEGTLQSVGKNESIFLSLSEADLQDLGEVAEEISNLDVNVIASSATAKAFKEMGVSVSGIVEVEQAAKLCEEGTYRLVCDTHQSSTYDLHSTLREKTYKRETTCLSSKETLVAYLRATKEVSEAPMAMKKYLSQSEELNKEKECAFK